ncbi:MAG: hypothetical protein FWD61_19970 [Phycisphaerales bacterium]|nr:hypothetical protein [Phycisphaerales bacterium]
MHGPLKPPKKPLSFPLWLEAAVVVIFLAMATVEFVHAQWFWAAIFGAGGVFFGIGTAARFLAGDKHDSA